MTVDRVILHIVVHQSSTSTYTLNLTEIKETLWTDVHTYGRTFETDFIRSTQQTQPKNQTMFTIINYATPSVAIVRYCYMRYSPKGKLSKIITEIWIVQTVL